MNRSNYNEEHDNDWAMIRYRGAVKSALRGRRGQAFLQELLQALDAMPHKRLIVGELKRDGEVCALGAVGRARGVSIDFDSGDVEALVGTFGIADAMCREIMWVNDEGAFWAETPEARFKRVREWVVENLEAA